jgi:hypothetical protein
VRACGTVAHICRPRNEPLNIVVRQEVTKMKRAHQMVTVFVVVISVMVLVLPLVVYEFSLAQVTDRPAFAIRDYSPDERQNFQARLKVRAVDAYQASNPYLYLYEFVRSGQEEGGSRSLVLAWLVARDHNSRNRDPEKSNRWWHLSGAALTIWITRNWTEQQVLNKLIELYG